MNGLENVVNNNWFYVVLGLFFGIFCAIYANKSTWASKNRGIEAKHWASLILAPAIIALLVHAFCFYPWVLCILLILTAALHLLNGEGADRRTSWNSLALLWTIMLILSVAVIWDKNGGWNPYHLFYLLAPIACFVCGAVKMWLMNRDVKEETEEEDDDLDEDTITAHAIRILIIAVLIVVTAIIIVVLK